MSGRRAIAPVCPSLLQLLSNLVVKLCCQTLLSNLDVKPLPLHIDPGFKMCLSKFNLRHYAEAERAVQMKMEDMLSKPENIREKIVQVGLNPVDPKLNPVDPQLETARLQPLSLPLDPS
jgi:hypothetical protein